MIAYEIRIEMLPKNIGIAYRVHDEKVTPVENCPLLPPLKAMLAKFLYLLNSRRNVNSVTTIALQLCLRSVEIFIPIFDHTVHLFFNFYMEYAVMI